jgi:pyridoxal phosphate enzyme (YggS family)
VKNAATIGERLASVRAAIAAACEQSGRDPAEVTLVGVSKTHPAVEVIAAHEAGLLDFGENRVEEAVDKIAEVEAAVSDASMRWHMIGHIQSRKARLIVPRFALVHSVDSVRLAEKLGRIASDSGRTLDILLEVNVSGEESKYGFNAHGWQDTAAVRESLWKDIRSILSVSGVRVQGLMTMAPIVADPEQTRPVFVGLRQLRDALQADFPQADWRHLSMGMTDDFPVAVQEGATIVRIGRAIFGDRMVR